MSELNIVPNGALLIRNGIIEDVGPARRVENLAGARKAREIDATGRVVMPAFVDADVALVSAGEPRTRVEAGATALRLMSRKKVLAGAAMISAECMRYGCLTVGAHTRYAVDLQNIGKVLRTHQALQMKPLRIRSIFSLLFPPGAAKTPSQSLDTIASKWLSAVRGKRLAAVVELTVENDDNNVAGFDSSGFDSSMLRTTAVAAAGLDYAIRLRSARRLEPRDLELALDAGAIGIIAPMDGERAFVGPLSAIGCVRLVPASEGFDDRCSAALAIRAAIDEGAAVAITSSYRSRGATSMNMQFLLHLAVAGMGLTPEEAITAATWNPACSLRLSQVTGSLEPGKSADALLMDVPDYRELPRRAGHHDVGLVIRAGQVIFRNGPLNVD